MMREKLSAKYMRVAIEEARKNLRKMEGGPFGACIVNNQRILAVARNTVLKHDATCHAEINAIRIASKRIKNFDLSGCCIYSTTEPCPMCFSAIHWSRIDAIVYGTNFIAAQRIGFKEPGISDIKMKTLTKSKIEIFAGFLRDECNQLLKEWNNLENKLLY